MIRLSCHTFHGCIWILHEGIQYFPSHKEKSLFQRKNNHKQSLQTSRGGKLPEKNETCTSTQIYAVVQNLTRQTSVLLFFFILSCALASRHSWDGSGHNLVKDERKESESISGEIGWPPQEISPLAGGRAPLARQVIPAVTPSAVCLLREGARVVVVGEGWRVETGSEQKNRCISLQCLF